MKRDRLIHTVFTKQGKIYIRMIEHGEITEVRNQEDLDQIIRDIRREA